MTFIQCSLTGTALSWYIRLNDTYKQDWHAVVQAFKKQFDSQQNAYYAQLEALNLTKKDNETVRHFALKVQQRRYRSRSTSQNNYYIKGNHSHTRYRSTSRDRFSYDKNTTPRQYTRSRYDNHKLDSS